MSSMFGFRMKNRDFPDNHPFDVSVTNADLTAASLR